VWECCVKPHRPVDEILADGHFAYASEEKGGGGLSLLITLADDESPAVPDFMP
jgi:hypothetical protein